MGNYATMKAIIVDLDRTLLRTDKTLSDYSVSVLQACRQRGIKLMVATARPLRETAQYRERIAFDAMTGSNGAKIVCGSQFIEHGIDRETAKNLLEALQANPNLRITLEAGDCAYSNKAVAEYETTLCQDLANLTQRVDTVKILVHLDREETLAEVQKLIPAGLYATVAHGFLMQIMSKAATKWNGIRTMLEISGISPQETIYFGDDQDDVEPLQKCGIGVAVANAIEEAKVAADHVAASNDEDGVAKFLEQLLEKDILKN